MNNQTQPYKMVESEEKAKIKEEIERLAPSFVNTTDMIQKQRPLNTSKSIHTLFLTLRKSVRSIPSHIATSTAKRLRKYAPGLFAILARNPLLRYGYVKIINSKHFVYWITSHKKAKRQAITLNIYKELSKKVQKWPRRNRIDK